jgi:hypothetical protein
MGAAQFFADKAQEHVAGGCAEIAGADTGGIAPAACAADGEDIKTQGARTGDDKGLRGHAIDGVHHKGVTGMDEAIGAGGGEEGVVTGDAAVGVDALDALGEDVDLWAAKFAFERGKLAVGVGDADIVEVDEGEVADGRTGKRLDDP